MPGRTWVIAPDRVSLEATVGSIAIGSRLPTRREALFHPHLVGWKNRATNTCNKGLHQGPLWSRTSTRPRGFGRRLPWSDLSDTAHRSFDRQWIIPDGRLLNRAEPQPLGQPLEPAGLHDRATPIRTDRRSRRHVLGIDTRPGPLQGFLWRFALFPLWADRERRTQRISRQACSERSLAKLLGITVEARPR